MSELDKLQAAAIVQSLLRAGEGAQPIALPDGFGERCSLAQARDLQAAHAQGVMSRLGGEIVGLKIGGTTEAALQRLGLTCPFTGPIFSARRHHSGARLRRDELIVCIVEAEIGVTLTHDVTPHSGVPNRGELLTLIDALCPAIELADSRLADWSSATASAAVADLGFAGVWVQGKPCADWRGINLVNHAVSLQLDGEVLRRGTGATVLGDPLRSLQLVLTDQVARGEAVSAGQWISTGSWTAPLPLPGKGQLHADFGALGSVSVELV